MTGLNILLLGQVCMSFVKYLFPPIRAINYGSRGHHITQKGIYTEIKLHLFITFFLIHCVTGHHHNLISVWSAGLSPNFSILLAIVAQLFLQIKDLLMVCVHVKNCFFFLRHHTVHPIIILLWKRAYVTLILNNVEKTEEITFAALDTHNLGKTA